MRHWLFHPLVFYPLAILLAALLIAGSIQPQKWPRPPAPVAGQVRDGALVLEGAAFNSPDNSPEQNMTVVRDFWGRPHALRMSVKPGQPEPTPAETGVRILLTDEAAAVIGENAVAVEVSYNPLSVNGASALAVSLQGIAPGDWSTQPLNAEPGVARYELPASFAVNALGLRAISSGDDQAYGVEITRIRIVARPS